jgi:para-nitrobenzyl esterase
VADAMHAAWVAFVTTGNPGHAGIPEWPRHEPSTRYTMHFAPDCSVSSQPNAAELALWDDVL